MEHFDSLREELDGIEETEVEMNSIMEHVKALQTILNNNAKKLVCNFLYPYSPSTNMLSISI